MPSALRALIEMVRTSGRPTRTSKGALADPLVTE
jgi:hypothetical protein